MPLQLTLATSSKAEVWSQGDPRVDVDRKVLLEDHSVMISAGGAQQKRKAAVWEESAGTQETNRANRTMWRWTETRACRLCSTKCRKRYGWLAQGRQIHVQHKVQERMLQVLQHRRPHTTNLCENHYMLKLAEGNEPEVIHARRKAKIGEKSSGGRLSACLGAKRFESRKCERFAVKKVRARDSRK